MAGKSSALPVEYGEQSPLRLLDEVLYSGLQPEPFKLAGDQLIAGHYRRHALLPVRADQRATASFLRLEPNGSGKESAPATGLFCYFHTYFVGSSVSL